MTADLYSELITDCRILSTEWTHLNFWSDPDRGPVPRFVALTDKGTTDGRIVNEGDYPYGFRYLWQAQEAADEYALRYHKARPAVISWAAYVKIRRHALIWQLRMVRDNIRAITLYECGEIRLDQFRLIIKGKLKRPRITA